jgi:t-SNARE complex subunit (syntaxin)
MGMPMGILRACANKYRDEALIVAKKGNSKVTRKKILTKTRKYKICDSNSISDHQRNMRQMVVIRGMHQTPDARYNQSSTTMPSGS